MHDKHNGLQDKGRWQGAQAKEAGKGFTRIVLVGGMAVRLAPLHRRKPIWRSQKPLRQRPRQTKQRPKRREESRHACEGRHARNNLVE
jgi:hypothetical protein